MHVQPIGSDYLIHVQPIDCGSSYICSRRSMNPKAYAADTMSSLMHVQQMFYDSSYIYKLIIRKLKNSVPVRHSLSFDSFSLFTFMLQRVKKQKETAGLCTSAGRANDLRRERAVRNAIALQQKRSGLAPLGFAKQTVDVHPVIPLCKNSKASPGEGR